MVLAFHRGIEFCNKSRMHVRSESLRLVGQRARDRETGGYAYSLPTQQRSQADLERGAREARL